MHTYIYTHAPKHASTGSNPSKNCNTQHTATHWKTLQYTAILFNTLQYTAIYCNALQHSATHCNKLQPTATNCNQLQHTTTQYHQPIQTSWGHTQHTRQSSTLHHTATHCNTLRHAAPHCNTPTTTKSESGASHFPSSHQESCRPKTPPPRHFFWRSHRVGTYHGIDIQISLHQISLHYEHSFLCKKTTLQCIYGKCERGERRQTRPAMCDAAVAMFASAITTSCACTVCVMLGIVLQCVAVCCSVLQCVAVCCSVL